MNDEGDEPHNLEGRFLFRRVSGAFEHILNLNVEQQFGGAADESTELEYIWRTRYSLDETTAIGFEAFGAPAFADPHFRPGAGTGIKRVLVGRANPLDISSLITPSASARVAPAALRATS